MTLLETDTRLRVARAIEKHEAQGSLEVMRTLKRRAHPEAPPPVVSDGGSGCADAMTEVWGEIPAYQGTGRYPKYKQALPGWQHLRVVKQKDEKGRVLGLDRRVVFGEETAVLDWSWHSTCGAHASDDAPIQWPSPLSLNLESTKSLTPVSEI